MNITSDAAIEPYEQWGGYGSSKAALEHLTAILAAERPDLRVLVVDPGDMRTEMHQDAFPGEDISDRPLPATVVPHLVAPLSAPLDPDLEASAPAEVRGRGRDDVRLLVSEGEDGVVHGAFPDLPTYLRAGDALVVNTSATVPAAISATLEDYRPVRVHFSTELPGGLWLVEARQPAGDTTSPMTEDLTGDLRLDGVCRRHLRRNPCASTAGVVSPCSSASPGLTGCGLRRPICPGPSSNISRRTVSRSGIGTPVSDGR